MVIVTMHKMNPLPADHIVVPMDTLLFKTLCLGNNLVAGSLQRVDSIGIAVIAVDEFVANFWSRAGLGFTYVAGQ